MTPIRGPVLFSVPGFANLLIGVGGTSGAIAFRWPRALFVTGVLWFPQTADQAHGSTLNLRIQDETFQDVISDGQGAVFAIPGDAANGQGFRYFALQRPVLDGDTWMLTVTNTGAVERTLSGLFFTFEDGLRQSA